MNQLKIFENPDFGQVRAITRKGEPWFVGRDVAKALGYGDDGKSATNAVSRHVDSEDKGVTEIVTPGGKQNITIINESGLYSLILSSKLPTAKKFKRWVTSEVLPSIRQTGGYIAGQEDMSDDDLLASALVVAKRKIEQRDKRIRQLQVDNSELAVSNQTMRPKAEYFDQLVDRNLLTNFRDTAKQLGINPRTFTKWLVDHKYLFRDKHGALKPYENKNNGLFELKEFYNQKTDFTSVQTLVTPKGRETFRLLCEGL